MDDITAVSLESASNRCRDLIAQLETSEFFKTVFDNGGFIAGGFARHAMTDGWQQNLDEAYRSYLLPRAADIDLFFRTKQGCSASFGALLNLPRSDWSVQNAKTDNAATAHIRADVVCRGVSHNERLRVQFVKCDFGTPTDIISRFDFTNCKFAFDRTDCYFSPRGISLENDNLLEITRINDSIYWRLNKYVLGHKKRKLTAESYKLYLDYAISQAGDAKVLAYVDKLIRAGFFRAEDTLLLSTAFPEERRLAITASLYNDAGHDYNLV